MSGDKHRKLHVVCEQSGWVCVYCGCELVCFACISGRESLGKRVEEGLGWGGARWATRDHVHPKAKGGTSTLDNLVAACGICNNKKGDRLNWSGTIEPEELRRLTDLGIKTTPLVKLPKIRKKYKSGSNLEYPWKALCAWRKFRSEVSAAEECERLSRGEMLIPFRCTVCGDWHVRAATLKDFKIGWNLE